MSDSVRGLPRRDFLALGAATAAMAAVPASTLPAMTSASVKRAPLPTWIVGTPGENDHEIIRAATREAAIRFRAEECEDDDDDFADREFCDCGACGANGGYEATRVERWDGRPEIEITGGDWVEAGFEASCDRCGYECYQDGGARSVQGKAICEDCLTPADWDLIDPERAAEMRTETAFAKDPSHAR